MGTNFTTTVLGLPRIGPDRELKRAIEGYWAGRVSREELTDTAQSLRRDSWRQLADAALDSVPTNTFSFYDQVLDTAELLGALPERVHHIGDPLDRYFAAARGTAKVAPLEMTKWFDTNYHYLVPEISRATRFALNPQKLFEDLALAQAEKVPARPVLIGPVTFLTCAKAVDGAGAPLDRLDEVLVLYAELLSSLADRGVQWVQLDEPVAVRDLTSDEVSALTRAYRMLSGSTDRPSILVATYFGTPDTAALAALATSDVDAVALDCVAGRADIAAAVPALRDKLVVAGVVDGRNVWRTDLDAALAVLGTLLGSAGAVAVSTSCSLQHVPYSLARETELDPVVTSWLAFAAEKVTEVAVLSTALRHGRESVATEFEDASRILAQRAGDPRVTNMDIRGRLSTVQARQRQRGPAADRRVQQHRQLGLPPLPTTTIGSFPQTREIRAVRAKFRAGDLNGAGYESAMKAEIASVIALQEEVGLDVLVHGEPERNDMVQYFAELLDGFANTDYGWVQSYGTRCVRPPILFGDVARPEPMTVGWSSYAQSLTDKPVKGMLTGPVTILAWSFVRDDQPAADSCAQIALAIRDETIDLQSAGLRIVQVDEPALRELLPLREADQAQFLSWAVDAFRLATSGVSDSTQIHTHLCYSEFGEVIGAIAALDADVTSIEAARSRMEILADLEDSGFLNEIGPGVYDIHSPRVPTLDEVAASLRAALDSVPAQRLWVNPDCGLKTRRTEEVSAALRNLVGAARLLRSELP